jgi:repressor LexA
MGDEATIKRFQKRGAKIILKPENPDYEPILVKSDEVVIEGVVIGVYRKFR